MFKFFKDTLQKRAILDGKKFKSPAPPTEFMVASVAVINNMGDQDKPVGTEAGCFSKENGKHGGGVQFCKLQFSNIPKHAANHGCAKKVDESGKFSPFDISACRAVSEPYELIEQLMPQDPVTSVTFINNDFAQAAAMFVNQGQANDGKNDMRLYTADNTFAAEDRLWQGEASRRRLI
jgi:hypothetical protein